MSEKKNSRENALKKLVTVDDMSLKKVVGGWWQPSATGQEKQHFALRAGAQNLVKNLC